MHNRNTHGVVARANQAANVFSAFYRSVGNAVFHGALETAGNRADFFLRAVVADGYAFFDGAVADVRNVCGAYAGIHSAGNAAQQTRFKRGGAGFQRNVINGNAYARQVNTCELIFSGTVPFLGPFL